MLLLNHIDRKARLLLALLILSALLLLLPTHAVFAGSGNPSGTGLPNQDCGLIGVTPGNASSAPGSAFNPNGQAGMVYAGEQPQNSNNPMSVSQYDVACFHVSQH